MTHTFEEELLDYWTSRSQDKLGRIEITNIKDHYCLDKQKVRDAIHHRQGRDNLNPDLISAKELLKELGL